MTDNSEEMTDEQLQRMAGKLLAGWKPSTALSGLGDEEKRMAAKLLGPSNAERLAVVGRGERFKYRRPNHKVEYYSQQYGWTIDLLENGVRRPFKLDLTDGELAIVLAAIKKKGVPILRFETEGEKQRRMERESRLDLAPTVHERPRSARFDVLNELKDFRL